MTSMSTNVGLLPERVEKAARERIAAGTYQTLAFAVVDGDKSEVVAYRSFFGFAADGRRGVVILANTAVSADDLGFATLDADAPIMPTYDAIVSPGASLDDYVGTYKLADTFLQVFRMDDELFVRATGQFKIPILPFALDAFFSKVWGMSISFTRDSSGVVSGLVQDGGRTARKLSASELRLSFRKSSWTLPRSAITSGNTDSISVMCSMSRSSMVISKHRSPGSPPRQSSRTLRISSFSRLVIRN
jgi:hypothetical protein